jgi:hypothetical protein
MNRRRDIRALFSSPARPPLFEGISYPVRKDADVTRCIFIDATTSSMSRRTDFLAWLIETTVSFCGMFWERTGKAVRCAFLHPVQPVSTSAAHSRKIAPRAIAAAARGWWEALKIAGDVRRDDAGPSRDPAADTALDRPACRRDAPRSRRIRANCFRRPSPRSAAPDERRRPS